MRSLTLCLCLLYSITHSQGLNFHSYSFDQGLNTYNIQKVIQDKHGFIWIATQAGLYRYTGTRFEVFKKFNTQLPALRENFIYDVSTDQNGDLYIAEYNAGIDKLDSRTLKVTPLISGRTDTSDGLPSLWVKKVYHDNAGNTWMGGGDFLSIYHHPTGKFTHIMEVPGFNKPVNVTAIRQLNQQRMVVSVMDIGLLLFDIPSLKCISTIPKLVPDPVLGNTTIQDFIVVNDTIYAATDIGVLVGKFVNREWRYLKTVFVPNVAQLVINSLVLDKKHNIWLGTNSGLGRVNANGVFQLIPGDIQKKRTLQDNNINHLFIDAQNNLWISTGKMLQMINLNANPFRSFSGDIAGSDKPDHTYSLIKKSEHEIFATATDGLYICDLRTGIFKKVSRSGALGIVHYLAQVDGTWFVSSDKGLYAHLPNGELSQQYILDKYPEWKPFIHMIFNNSIHVNSNVYWASEGEEGLIKWNLASRSIQQFKSGKISATELTENHLHNIKLDTEGNMWLLGDRSIAKFDVKRDAVIQTIHFSPKGDGPNSSIYFDMYDDGEVIWIGTYGGGVNGYDKKKKTWYYITEKEGLCNNNIYGLLSENDSMFWASSDMGLARINSRARTCVNYYYEDGLQDNSFDEKGALAIGSKLYFGGINGFTEVDLEKVQIKSKDVPVYVYRIDYMQGREKIILNNFEWNEIRIPPKASTITIHLAALAYGSNRKGRFEYNMPGIQEEFIPSSEDNTITFNPSNPGSYKFNIRFLGDDASFVRTLQLAIYVVPRWYQTWWFRTLLILLALAAVSMVFRLRINQLKKEQRIRSKLASDLHDDLGSTLQSVKVYSNLALIEKGVDKHLHKIKESTQEAIIGLRDIIWVLDDNKNTIQHLLTRINHFAAPLCEANHINFREDVNDSVLNLALGQEEKRNLYMILKEAINNSLKYAEAKTIELLVSIAKDKPQIILKDDGKGFEFEKAQFGNGLKNMHARADEIKYSISITSDPGSGTKISLIKSS